jgi:hypothetical protein
MQYVSLRNCGLFYTIHDITGGSFRRFVCTSRWTWQVSSTSCTALVEETSGISCVQVDGGSRFPLKVARH